MPPEAANKMPDAIRDKIKENLAVGAALGVLTLMVALLSVVADSSSTSFEKAAFTAAAENVAVASRVDDPDFRYVYLVRGTAENTYGVVFSERSRDASALFSALFSTQGELRELKLLGSCASRLPEDARAALDSIAGLGDTLDRAAKAARAAAEADS
jgi:hypothetical protein